MRIYVALIGVYKLYTCLPKIEPSFTIFLLCEIQKHSMTLELMSNNLVYPTLDMVPF